MLNTEVRKEFLNILRPNPLWRQVVQVFEFACFKGLALLRNLLFDKPVNLCLQILLLINNFFVQMLNFLY